MIPQDLGQLAKQVRVATFKRRITPHCRNKFHILASVTQLDQVFCLSDQTAISKSRVLSGSDFLMTG